MKKSTIFIFLQQKNRRRILWQSFAAGNMVINNQTKIKSCRIGANIVAANAVNDTKGSMGAAYMSQVISGNLSSHKGNLSPLYLYNKVQNYTLFMIPALLSIVMMLMTELTYTTKNPAQMLSLRGIFYCISSIL